MSFQDELRHNLKSRDELFVPNNKVNSAAINAEANQVMEDIRNGLVTSARNANYTVAAGQTFLSYIHPISQRFIRKQRMDNGNQIAANSKRGLFRDRSLVYRVWYSFQVEPKFEEEYILLQHVLNELATRDGVRIDYILYDQRTRKEHSFPTQIDGFQFAQDFVLAVRGTTNITL